MSEFPHVPAAFINAIREEGTKAEACDYLQQQWNETCWLRKQADLPATDEQIAADPREVKAEPRFYLYRYTDPISGKAIWRADNSYWNGQRPSQALPLYEHPPTDPADHPSVKALVETVKAVAMEAYGYGHLYETAFHAHVHEELTDALAQFTTEPPIDGQGS